MSDDIATECARVALVQRHWRPQLVSLRIRGYLEDRDPSPDAPIAECFYDQDGRLVDDKHPYAGCKGTPDSYSASDRWNHIFNDPGGVAQAGIPAFLESIQHAGDEMVRKRKEALERMGYPVYGIGPFRAPRPR